MLLERLVFVGHFGKFNLISVQIVQYRLLVINKFEFFFFFFFIGLHISVVLGLEFFELSLEGIMFGFPDFNVGLLFFELLDELKLLLLELGELIAELSIFFIEPLDWGHFTG